MRLTVGAHIGAGRGRRAVAALAAAAALGAAALFGATPGAAAASGSTLRLALETQVSTFNPFLAYFDGELETIGDIYPTLTQLDAQNKPEGYLATSWTTSPDKLTWTFTIRKGLKWSDGTPLTAHDAAWTLNLIMTNTTAATANGSLVSNFAKVTAPDDTTLVIKTETPQANMLYVSLPVSGIPIVPEHIWASRVANLKNTKNTSYPVVGYGPWVLTGYQTDQYATLDANPDYYAGAPKYSKLILQYFKNNDAAVAALRSGQIDQVGDVTATQFGALKGEKNILAYQQVGNGWTAMEVNSGAKTRQGKPIGTGNPALADPVVRKAIAFAIDRKTLVSKVFDDLGVVGAAYLPPAYPQWAWSPSAAQAIGYDPGRANQLLQAAGYTKGANGIREDPQTHKPLQFRLGIHSDSTTDAQVATYLVGWLKAVGIGVTLQAQSMTALNDNLAKGDWDMLMDSWTTGADPTYLLGIQTCATLPLNDGTGGNTDAFYCNPAYDRLFNAQVGQFDQATRAKTIAAMQAILYEANADIILVYKNGLSAVRTDQTSGFVSGSPDAKGFYPAQNLFASLLKADPVAGAGTSHTGAFVGGGIALVVVLAVLAALFLRRRSTAADRE